MSAKMSKAIKLTQAQKDVVRKMRAGESLRRGVMSGNWIISKETVKYTTCYALRNHNLIEEKETYSGKYTLTDIGLSIDIGG